MLRTVIRAALFTGNPSSQNSHLVVIYIALLAYETLSRIMGNTNRRT